MLVLEVVTQPNLFYHGPRRNMLDEFPRTKGWKKGLLASCTLES